MELLSWCRGLSVPRTAGTSDCAGERRESVQGLRHCQVSMPVFAASTLQHRTGGEPLEFLRLVLSRFVATGTFLRYRIQEKSLRLTAPCMNTKRKTQRTALQALWHRAASKQADLAGVRHVVASVTIEIHTFEPLGFAWFLASHPPVQCCRPPMAMESPRYTLPQVDVARRGIALARQNRRRK